MLPWRLIADSVLDNGLREEHAKSWRGTEESITWLCLGLPRSSQSYNKTHNRYRRWTPLRFTQLIPVGFLMAHVGCAHTVFMLTHTHKLEIETRGTGNTFCMHNLHILMCMPHSSLASWDSEFPYWTEGQSLFSLQSSLFSQAQTHFIKEAILSNSPLWEQRKKTLRTWSMYALFSVGSPPIYNPWVKDSYIEKGFNKHKAIYSTNHQLLFLRHLTLNWFW